jgi:hypothetical protein
MRVKLGICREIRAQRRFKSPRCVKWNVDCRDFVAKSCPAGRTYKANRRDVLSRTSIVATSSRSPARQAGPTRQIAAMC